MKLKILLILAILMLSSGCINFKKVGKNLAIGTEEGIRLNRDSLATDLGVIVKGARDSLLNDETDLRLKNLADSLGNILVSKIQAIRDIVTGEATRQQLEKIIAGTGDAINKYLTAYRDTLTSEKTIVFFENLVNRAILDTLPAIGAILRKELFGEATRTAIDSLVYRAISSIARGYKDSLLPVVSETRKGFEISAKTILWTAGVIIAILIVLTGFIIRRSFRRQKILNLVTRNIDRIPNQNTYDELVARIEASAKSSGIISDLNIVLSGQGIKGKESWIGPEDNKTASPED